LSSKIHTAVRGLGLPVRFILTAGQRNDITQASGLICGLPADFVMGDTAYDGDHFRQDIAAIGAQAVIPSNPSRARKPRLDKALYKERHLIECCFNKLKQFRRIATRYEKTASAFLAMITVAAIALWLG
jgi:transposase